jgi:hypothetical protein
MRKIIGLAGILLLAIPLAFSQGKIAVRALAPLDFKGTMTVSSSSNDSDFDVTYASGIGAEMMANVYEGLNVGGGVQDLYNHHDMSADMKGYGEFAFIPI